MSEQRLLRRAEVVKMTGLGRSSIYRLMAAGSFPRPVRLSQRSVAWRSTDLSKWINSRQAVNARGFVLTTGCLPSSDKGKLRE
jgi:prophage regulatory protein